MSRLISLQPSLTVETLQHCVTPDLPLLIKRTQHSVQRQLLQDRYQAIPRSPATSGPQSPSNSMSSEAALLWQKVLDRLSDMASGRAADMGEALHEVYDLPPQSAATWRGLIQDMQLPRQIGCLASSLLSDDSSSMCPYIIDTLVGTVGKLLHSMAVADISCVGDLVELWPPLQQQMEESGLISCLKPLMEVTAEQLERCTAAAAAVAAEAAAAARSEAVVRFADRASFADNSTAVGAAAADAAAAAGHGAAAVAAAAAGAAAAVASAAEQLELDSTAALGAIAGVATPATPAPGSPPAPTTSNVWAVDDVEALHWQTGQLLEAYVLLCNMINNEDDTIKLLGSTEAAVTRLMVAGMRHISIMLQQQEQQQIEPPVSLFRVADSVAASTVAASCTAFKFSKSPVLPSLLVSRGAHGVTWSDMAMLLTTYASIFQQQQGELPLPGSGSAAATPAPAPVPAVHMRASSAGSSSSGSSISTAGAGSTQEQQPGGSLHASTDVKDAHSDSESCVRSAVWQHIQGQWDRIPASDQQLLQLLGVSPQAAVWLAALMSRDGDLSTPSDCWQWNPHNVIRVDHASMQSSPAEAASSVLELQKQLKQCEDETPLRPLVQLSLLYWTVHAAPDDELLLGYSRDVWQATVESLRMSSNCEEYRKDAQTELIWSLTSTQLQMAYRPGGSGPGTVLSLQVQEELLLLTLQLLQRLQQLRKTLSETSLSTAADTSLSLHRFFSLQCKLQFVRAEAQGVEVLIVLLDSLPFNSPSLNSTAAQAAGSTAAGQPAGGGHTTPFHPLIATARQQAGTLLSAFEHHLRIQSIFSPCGVRTPLSLVEVCRNGPDNQPRLLLWLAQGGTGEQQVAFFNILVSLLKLTATSKWLSEDRASYCRFRVAEGASHMLLYTAGGNEASLSSSAVALTASAADAVGRRGSSVVRADSSSSTCGAQASSSSSTKSGALWLLLLSRCCLTWADALAERQQEHGGGLVQLFQQAQQGPASQSSNLVLRQDRTVSCCFAGSRPLLLKTVQSVVAALQEGSRISAGLTAAGYDMGPVLQCFEAIAACYPGVLNATEPDAAGAARMLPQLITALAAAGKASSVFAVPHCCNNPGCNNLAGPAEVSIVPGSSFKCSSCKVARYCGRPCQKAHWKQHKPVCKMLAARSKAVQAASA